MEDFVQYLINNKIPYKQIGNNKISLSTIDSVNGNRHRFVVDLNTGDSSNDPFAHPGPVSWKVTKDTDGYILKGVNSMYRDQLFMPTKKEAPQLYEVIEKITAPHKVVTSNKPKSTSTTNSTSIVTKSTGTKSTATKKYKRTLYDSEGNVVSLEDFYPTKEDLDTLSQRLGQRTPVSLEKGDKIEEPSIFYKLIKLLNETQAKQRMGKTVDNELVAKLMESEGDVENAERLRKNTDKGIVQGMIIAAPVGNVGARQLAGQIAPKLTLVITKKIPATAGNILKGVGEGSLNASWMIPAGLDILNNPLDPSNAMWFMPGMIGKGYTKIKKFIPKIKLPAKTN